MKLALECPVNLLDQIQPFADFDFILANFAKSDKAYAEYYKRSTNYKMLDNGVTETGEPLSLGDIESIANDLVVDHIVARDYIGDYEKTVAGYAESVKKFGAERVLGVLQGSTPEEALKCHVVLEKACPAVLVPYHVGGSDRRKDPWLMTLKRALVISHLPTSRPIHLLGFTTLDEFQWYAGMSHVWAMDTDVPVKAGLAVQDLSVFDRATKNVPTTLTKDSWAAVCRNIALLRKYMA